MIIFNIPICVYSGRFKAIYSDGSWRFFNRYGARFWRSVPRDAAWRKKVIRRFWPVMTNIAAGALEIERGGV
jgi:hypothetical protein